MRGAQIYPDKRWLDSYDWCWFPAAPLQASAPSLKAAADPGIENQNPNPSVSRGRVCGAVPLSIIWTNGCVWQVVRGPPLGQHRSPSVRTQPQIDRSHAEGISPDPVMELDHVLCLSDQTQNHVSGLLHSCVQLC